MERRGGRVKAVQTFRAIDWSPRPCQLSLASPQFLHLAHPRWRSVPVVQRLAGHADIKTTMGYVHIDGTDLRSAIERTFGSFNSATQFQANS